MTRIFALALVCSACGSSIAPSPPLLPLVLAGQSNADFLRPFLVSAASPRPITGTSNPGSRLAEWDVDAPTGYWRTLAPALHHPLRAFVWWQGESDAATSTLYLGRLAEFIQRVRVEAADAQLPVVICRVVDDPAFVGIRAAQDAYVASDTRSVLVSSDGLPREHPDWTTGSAHLSAEGYAAMAQRILAALP